MSRYLSIGLSIFLLTGAVVGSFLAIGALRRSIETYRSPLQQVELPTQPASLPQMGRVVVVLVSGLGYDASQTLPLPEFSQLAQTGASAAMQGFPPTYSQTSWVTLISGAPPETNSAPPVDRPAEALSLVDVDTIFARAHQAQKQTAIFGPIHWQRLISRNQLDQTFFVNGLGPEADQAIIEAALPLIKNNSLDLVLLHLTQLDFAARHQGGPGGNAYRQAVSRIDSYLEQISRAVDTSRGVLVILGDHGHIASGGHGGDEAEVIWQPLVMVGSSIAPGSYSDISQTDVAPTITTLLGAAPPAAAQGRILFEMLRLDEQSQTVAQLTLARQRLALAQAYLAQLQGPSAALPDSLPADLEQAQTTLTQNNFGGAYQLAQLVQNNADTQITATRHSRIRAEQWPRLLIALLILLVWFGIMWRRRGEHAGLILIATIVTIGLYHALFQIQGYSYSISALGDFSELPFDVARRTAVSLLAGGGLVLIFLMLVNEQDWVVLLGTGYGFGVLVTFIFALPLFWAYWQNGLVVNWYLPAVGPVFWQITGLLEVMIAAILGLLLPWPIMLLNLLVNKTRGYLNQQQPQPEPDALPGLHL